MFIPLVLAISLTPPAPVGPLSPASLPSAPTAIKPADLPPPFVPPASPGADVLSVELQVDGREYPLAPAEFPNRAVAAVATLPGFLFAEAGPDGVVRGYTDACRLAVVTVPDGERVYGYVMVAAASTNKGVAERTRAALTAALGNPATGTVGQARAGRPDPERETLLPPLHWHRAARLVTPHGSYLRAVTGLAVERRGYRLTTDEGGTGWSMVSGMREAERRLLVGTAVCWRKTTTVLVASTGADPADAEAEVRAVCDGIVRALYD